MMDKRVWRVPCLLLVAFVVAISTSSCDLPLPISRQLHTARETATPTEQPTSEPSVEPIDKPLSVPTNTPI